MRAALLLALALTACRTRTPDSELYLEALRIEDAERAHSACERISDAGLRGECQLHAAAGVAPEDFGQAADLCGRMGDGMWREECWFLITDEAALTGPEATSACQQAGRYRANCLGHAIGREVKDLEQRFGALGQEPTLQAQIEDTVGRYKPGAPPEQRQATSRRMVAQILSKRQAGGPFDAGACGEAPDELCRLSYRMNLDAAPAEIDIEGLCAGEITLERVQQARAPYWAEGSEAMALAAWAELCDDLRSGRVVRSAERSMGVPPRGAPAPDAMPGELVPPGSP